MISFVENDLIIIANIFFAINNFHGKMYFRFWMTLLKHLKLDAAKTIYDFKNSF
jgi:hypothetical protein